MTLPKKILVATDFSACGDRASEVAIEWAERLGSDLDWVHGVEHLPETTPPSSEPLIASYVEQVRRLSGQKLMLWTERARARGLTSNSYCVDEPVADSIVEQAREIGSDCIVVGTKGYTGLRHMLLGSIAERVTRRAACSVLVVRGERSPLVPGTIVLGDDLGAESDPARTDAFMLAEQLAAKLHVVHALDLGIPYFASMDLALPQGVFERTYADALERMQRNASASPDVEIENAIVSERPVAAICDQAQKVDAGLIVIGSHSRRGIDRLLLGSVAEKVLRHAACSVYVAR